MQIFEQKNIVYARISRIFMPKNLLQILSYMQILMDKLAVSGQFWHENGQIGRDLVLGTFIAILRVKTQLRILRQQRKLRKLR